MLLQRNFSSSSPLFPTVLAATNIPPSISTQMREKQSRLTGVHFCPFSRTMKCVLSSRDLKNSSVSTTVPSSSKTRVTIPAVITKASKV